MFLNKHSLSVFLTSEDSIDCKRLIHLTVTWGRKKVKNKARGGITCVLHLNQQNERKTFWNDCLVCCCLLSVCL